MTKNEFEKVESLLRLFSDYPTYTKAKTDILKTALRYLESGPHEYFTSTCWTQSLAYVGEYYTESEGHTRRGTLMKYRGKSLMVMCVGHGSYFIRHYIVAAID